MKVGARLKRQRLTDLGPDMLTTTDAEHLKADILQAAIQHDDTDEELAHKNCPASTTFIEHTTRYPLPHSTPHTDVKKIN